MDFRTMAVAFGAVLVAELADKTQLVSLSLSARSGKPLSVFVGSLVAYSLVTAASVVLGALAARYLKPDLMRMAGGGVFVGLGILMLLKKI